MNIFKWFITPTTESKHIDKNIEEAVTSYLHNMPLVKTKVRSIELLEEDRDFLARLDEQTYSG